MKEPLTSYQRRLVLFLGVATFFEGFDQIALAQLLPTIRAEMHLSDVQTGLMVAVTNFGTVLAYVLIRAADRFGRKPILTTTIVGYTLCTFATSLVSSAIPYALFQMLARVFLIGEWALSMVYAAEEFPAARRGWVFGILNLWGAVGTILCAGLVPLFLKSPWGWRSVYFTGTVPLLLLAFARRGLRETERFQRLSASERIAPRLMRIWRTPYRRRVLELAVIWAATYVCTQTAVTFAKQHWVEELHMEEGTAGLLIAGSAVGSMPLLYFVGGALDRFGRRRTAVVVFVATALGCVGSYTLASPLSLVVPTTLAIFGASAVLPVLNAFTTEYFPTELRGDAFAWTNNILGRTGYVAAPILVGTLAQRVGWGPAVACTAVGPLLALGLIWLWLPETKGLELEQTARLDAHS
jgi:MFS transporter, putative metabolite:H+ symporter